MLLLLSKPRSGHPTAVRSRPTCAALRCYGVVLIGDAAGYNDPVLGQGLSIAVRDVRFVAEALLAEPDWLEAGVDSPAHASE